MSKQDSKGRLFVPMELSALICPTLETVTYADIQRNYNTLIFSPSGRDIETSPLTSISTPMDNGLHLHWVLPEALTHGVQREKGETVYPPIPNRYLIARMSYMKEEPLEVRCWIVESDALGAMGTEYNKHSPAFPVEPGTGGEMTFSKFWGDCREFDGKLTHGTEHIPELTAVSGGDVIYTAYYPMCRNVLGFCDNTLLQNNTREGRANEDNPAYLTYLVAGWYETGQKATRDPFDGITTWGELRERFSWISDSEKPDTDVFPHELCCYGWLSDIVWKGTDARYSGGMPDISDIPKVAIGSSSSEAMGALATSYSGNPYGARLIHALMEDSLFDNDRLDSASKQQSALHSSGFSSVYGGTLSTRRDSDETDSALSELRDTQRKKERIRQDRKRIIQKCNEIWYSYADQDQQLDTVLSDLNRCKEELDKLDGKMKEQTAREENLLCAIPKSGHMSEPDERFYLPNSPVVLLDGAGRNSPLEARRLSENGEELVCRLDTEIIRSRFIKDKSVFGTEDGVKLTADEVVSVWKPVEGTPDWFCKLVGECVLLAEGTAPYLARYLIQREKIGASLQDRLASTLKACAGSDQEAGVSPAPPSVSNYSPGWEPLLLEWNVNFCPDSELREGKFTFKNWVFKDGDYRHKASDRSWETKNPLQLTGRTILTPHASDLLRTQSSNKLGLDTVGYHVLSQALDGFDTQLLLRNVKMQYPPSALENLDPGVAALAASMLNGEETLMPCTDGEFYPVRAGIAQFDRLSVVDVFGRRLDYEPNTVCVPESMMEDGTPSLETDHVPLPVRVLQPARLRTRFPSENGMECALPGDISMLCGFIWPDFMDSALLIYDPDGNWLGNLVSIKDPASGKPATVWRNAPGEHYLDEGYTSGIDPQLKGMLEGIRSYASKEGQVLADFLEMIDHCFWQMTLSDGNKTITESALLGSPLALVRADVRLELKGKELLPPQYSDCLDSGSRITQIPFTVRLGGPEIENDGLIGFYRLSAEHPYSRFHVCGINDEQSGYMDNENEIRLYPKESFYDMQQEPWESLLMLMDPRGSVNMTSGILPVHTLRLQMAGIEKAMKRMAPSVFCAPLLSPRGTFSFPIPGGDEKYRFIYAENEGQWTFSDDIHPVDEQRANHEALAELWEGWICRVRTEKEGE